MLTALLLALGLGAVGMGVNAALSESANSTNLQNVQDTNATNLQISRETNAANQFAVDSMNAANAQQAELAYKRSLPTQQVSNMMSAGMSRNAALQALTGGGSYTAPVLQSATANAAQMSPATNIAPHLDFNSLADKIFSTPSNAKQSELIDQQIKDAQQQFDINMNEERRKQEMFEFDKWSRQFGKDVALHLDGVSSKVNNALLDSGKDISYFDSFESMLRGLNLADDPDIRKMPHLARAELEESVRSKFADSRAQQQQQNANVAAIDSHKLSEIQRNKLRAELDDFNTAKTARDKEYKLRAVEANVRQIASSRNLLLDKDAIDECFEFDKDGNVILENGVPKIKDNTKMRPDLYGKIRGFWNDVAEIVPVNVLSQIIRYALAK